MGCSASVGHAVDSAPATHPCATPLVYAPLAMIAVKEESRDFRPLERSRASFAVASDATLDGSPRYGVRAGSTSSAGVPTLRRSGGSTVPSTTPVVRCRHNHPLTDDDDGSEERLTGSSSTRSELLSDDDHRCDERLSYAEPEFVLHMETPSHSAFGSANATPRQSISGSRGSSLHGALTTFAVARLQLDTKATMGPSQRAKQRIDEWFGGLPHE